MLSIQYWFPLPYEEDTLWKHTWSGLIYSLGPIKLNWRDWQTGSFLWRLFCSGAQPLAIWKSKKYCKSSIGGLSDKRKNTRKNISIVEIFLKGGVQYKYFLEDYSSKCYTRLSTFTHFKAIMGSSITAGVITTMNVLNFKLFKSATFKLNNNSLQGICKIQQSNPNHF